MIAASVPSAKTRAVFGLGSSPSALIRTCLLVVALLVAEEDAPAGPLDENRAQPLASDRLVLQTRPWRISMVYEKQLIGLVAIVSASGDTVQFSTHSGATIVSTWSQLPAVVRDAFTNDRASLLFPPYLSVEESLHRAGAKGILGRVVQKLPTGILVALSTPNYRTEFTFYGNETVTVSSRDIPAFNSDGGQVFVKNHPNESVLQKDDEINFVGFLQGAFAYQGRMVPVFSARLWK